MNTKQIVSILLLAVMLIGSMFHITSCQKQSDTSVVNETVLSEDYQSLQNQPINYIVSNVGGNYKMISIGISPQSLYIQDTDTDLIKRLNDAISKKEVVSLWNVPGSGGKFRVVKISKPNTDEEKRFREFINSFDQSKSARISATPTFTNYTAVSNAFNYVSNKSCSINNIYGCIPFAYIADGCAARAHGMKRAIESQYPGYTCDKIFFKGRLVGKNSSCCLEWQFHVAPLVYVGTTQYVLDPSMFNGPVSPTVWKNKILSTTDYVSLPYGTQYIKSGNYYSFKTDGTFGFDDSYSKTDATLAAYRNKSGCNGLIV